MDPNPNEERFDSLKKKMKQKVKWEKNSNPLHEDSNPSSGKVMNKPRTHERSKSSQERFESILENKAFD